MFGGFEGGVFEKFVSLIVEVGFFILVLVYFKEEGLLLELERIFFEYVI